MDLVLYLPAASSRTLIRQAVHQVQIQVSKPACAPWRRRPGLSWSYVDKRPSAFQVCLALKLWMPIDKAIDVPPRGSRKLVCSKCRMGFQRDFR